MRSCAIHFKGNFTGNFWIYLSLIWVRKLTTAYVLSQLHLPDLTFRRCKNYDLHSIHFGWNDLISQNIGHSNPSLTELFWRNLFFFLHQTNKIHPYFDLKNMLWIVNTTVSILEKNDLILTRLQNPVSRADYRFVTSQWETLLCNNISHWLGANLESALCFRTLLFLLLVVIFLLRGPDLVRLGLDVCR